MNALSRCLTNRRHNLLNSLALFATNLLARVADAFALVRFRRIKATDVRGHLANQFFVYALNCNLRIIGDSDLDVCRNRKRNRMRETEAQVKDGTLNGSLETYSFDLELLGESLTHTLHHVVHEAARKPMQRFHAAGLCFAHQGYSIILHAGP